MAAGPGPIVGHAAVQSRLALQLGRGRVGHAYLFLGAPGSGKARMARHFAMAILCQRQPAANEGSIGWLLSPCGECESCSRAAHGTHPELIEVEPDSEKKQNISIEQTRSLRANAALMPKFGDRRVYLMPHAELLNEASANTLLKTLEEPQLAATLILCAPSPGLVLPTIRSRCQTIRFSPVPDERLTAALLSQGVTADVAEPVVRLAQGRPELALELLSDAPRREQLLQVEAFTDQVLAAVGAAAGRGEDMLAALRFADELLTISQSVKIGDGDRTAARRGLAALLQASALQVGRRMRTKGSGPGRSPWR